MPEDEGRVVIEGDAFSFCPLAVVRVFIIQEVIFVPRSQFFGDLLFIAHETAGDEFGFPECIILAPVHFVHPAVEREAVVPVVNAAGIPEDAAFFVAGIPVFVVFVAGGVVDFAADEGVGMVGEGVFGVFHEPVFDQYVAVHDADHVISFLNCLCHGNIHAVGIAFVYSRDIRDIVGVVEMFFFLGQVSQVNTETGIGLFVERGEIIVQNGIILVDNRYDRESMRHIIHYINSFFKKPNWTLLAFVFIFLIFLSNTLYVTYPDEFVNLLGGRAINSFQIPYRDFFDHHLPFAWYLSAVLLWFSFGSYVLFRIWWAVFAFGVLLGAAFYIRKRKPEIFPFYLGYFFIFPLVSVYYWMHLFLADSLAFLFFSVIFWILLVESYEKTVKPRTLYILSLVNFAFLFSSLTYVLVAGILYLWMLYLLWRQKTDLKRVLRFIAICAAPYMLYGLYLLITNSWRDFYVSNFVYNTKLYIDIPNYTRGRFFNPLKFVLTIIYNFYQTYLPLLVRIKEFNLYFPVDLTLALGSFILLIFFFFENKVLFVLLFLILSFSAPRSDLRKLGETDYQASLFIALGYISALVVFWRYKYHTFREEYAELFKKVLGVFLLLFFIFSVLFLAKNTYDKFYLRYTQKMPGIYDIAYSASFIDDILAKGDYYWIGPYEPNEEFFVKNASLPGKFPSLLPQYREDEYFKSSFLQQFENHPPKIIIYKHNASIFMTPSMEFGAFFIDWMKGKYTSIENIPGVRLEKSPSSFNMREDLYLLNSDKAQLLEKLQEKGYITLH